MQSVTTEDLRTVIALSDLPEEHLQWILDHSEYHEYEDGALMKKTGDEADAMVIILEGRIDFYLNVNGQLVYYYYFANDGVTGGMSGLLPYSRMKSHPGNSFAVGKLRILTLHKKHFPELERINPDFIQRLIGYMTERARSFATTQMQHEKVSALGRLSAGIAHELNNPASAIDRISSELTHRLQLNYELTHQLLRHNINTDLIHNLESLVGSKHTAKSNKGSALQRIENEDTITHWLQEHGYPPNAQAVETFAEAGFSGEDFDRMSKTVSPEAFVDVLLWFENLLASQRVIKDLAEASAHISKLVAAIKSHVQMDRTNELQQTNIHDDIGHTLTLLGYKLRDKKIKVTTTFCDNLPSVSAYVGELNQVWTNIIDNAIYALGEEGALTIETTCDDKNVNVRIIDNGTGIPPEILSRIFDPFFTTKKVGEGTGIGLDLVKRIIKHHNGDIKVNSKPGRTEFLVCIPVSQHKPS